MIWNMCLLLAAVFAPPHHAKLVAPATTQPVLLFPQRMGVSPPASQPAPTLNILAAQQDRIDLSPWNTYVVTSAVIWQSRSNITVDGHGATVLVDPSTSISQTEGSTFIFSSCSHVRVRNIHFDSQRQLRPGSWNANPQTLYLIKCRDVTVEDCTFTNDVCDGVYGWGGGSPSFGDECRDIRVLRCTFDNSGRNAISFTAAAFVSIDHCEFRHIRAAMTTINAGVDIEPNPTDPPGMCHDIHISNCTAVDCVFGLTGFNPSGTYNLVFVGNTVAYCDYGIITEHSGTIIHDNTVVGAAIYADNCDAAKVYNNTIVGTEPSCCIYIDNTHVPPPLVGHWVYGNKVHSVVGNLAPPNIVLSNNP